MPSTKQRGGPFPLSSVLEEVADEFAAHERCVRDLIDRNGWAVQNVAPLPRDGVEVRVPEDLGFAYTVGLTAKGLPELWVAGLLALDTAVIATTVRPRCLA